MNGKIRQQRSGIRSRRGMASALIILLLVLLIFFGVLSLVTAAADLRLARKRAEWNRQYYLTDSLAVQVVADLEQYCLTLKPENLEPGSMADLLDRHLSGLANVQEYTVSREDPSLRLKILVTGESSSGQGIQLDLLVRSGRLAAGSAGRLTVTGWTQWQQPFAYDDTGGGIWKG
jgi:hypothetical protein